jgi:hypothetical protein
MGLLQLFNDFIMFTGRGAFSFFQVELSHKSKEICVFKSASGPNTRDFHYLDLPCLLAATSAF